MPSESSDLAANVVLTCPFRSAPAMQLRNILMIKTAGSWTRRAGILNTSACMTLHVPSNKL